MCVHISLSIYIYIMRQACWSHSAVSSPAMISDKKSWAEPRRRFCLTGTLAEEQMA